MVAVIGLAAVGVAEVVPTSARHDSVGGTAGSALLREVTDPLNPNHASGAVVLTDVKGHPAAVYWQGLHLCYATRGTSACSSVNGTADQPVTVQNIVRDGLTFVSVAPGVARVTAASPDGGLTTVPLLHAPGFPFAAGIVDGPVSFLQAFGPDGARLGDAVAGTGALQLRQVREVAPCGPVDPGVAGAIPDQSGKECYLLESPAAILVPKSAAAEYDSTMGYTVQVTLTAKDRVVFGSITRTIAAAPAPGNRLAMVFNGRVLSAPAINQAILDGVFQIMGGPDKPFTKQEAAALAKQLTQ